MVSTSHSEALSGTAPAQDPLAPLLDALARDAAARDRAGGHAGDQKALLRAHGLLLHTIPREHGGLGRDWRAVFSDLRRIAAVDSALAHVLAFHHLQVATVLIYGNPEQRQRLLGATAERGLWWGNAMNPLDRRLEARPASDGSGDWRIDGQKSFCSATNGSDLMTFSASLTDADGFLLGVVPTRQPGIRILDDWDPIGQRQTDSNTVRFDDVTLPAVDVLRGADAKPTAWHTLRTCVAQLVLVNLYAGIADGALATARQWVREQGKPRAGASVQDASEDPFMLNRFGEMHLHCVTATVLADRAAERLDAAFSVGPALLPEGRAEVALAVAEAKVTAHRAGLHVSQELFEATGARGTQAALSLDRFWRNARTHTLHDPLDYKVNQLGRWALKGEAPAPGVYS